VVGDHRSRVSLLVSWPQDRASVGRRRPAQLSRHDQVLAMKGRGSAASQATRHNMARVERQLDLLDTTVDMSYASQIDARLLLLANAFWRLTTIGSAVQDCLPDALAHALLALPVVPDRYVGELLLFTRLGHFPTMDLTASTALPKLVMGPIVRLLTAPRERFANPVPRSPQQLVSETPHGRIPTALTGITLQSLSDYDLDLATILLCAVKYLGIAEGRSVAFAVEFLRSTARGQRHRIPCDRTGQHRKNQ
jgi:hypothetical protein